MSPLHSLQLLMSACGPELLPWQESVQMPAVCRAWCLAEPSEELSRFPGAGVWLLGVTALALDLLPMPAL